MALDIRIDPDSATPPYEQLRMQIIALVRDEELIAGARLPTVRAMAADLGIAVNTVAKAYLALESDGVIFTRGRSGSFVAETGDVTRTKAQRAAMEYVATLRRLGISDEDALRLVRTALGDKRA